MTMFKVYQWLSLIIPWASLFLMKRDAVRRYMPVALFVTAINTIIAQLAWSYHWWTNEKPLFPWARVADIAFTYGIFLVGTMWIFYFTFRRFWLYLVVNLVIDGIFAFGATTWLESHGVLRRGSITHFQFYLMAIGVALVIYLYQLWQEGVDMEVTVGRRSRART